MGGSATRSAPPASGSGRRRPFAPGVAYGSLAVVMLLLLAALALTTRQPPPPSIAEFAPQALEQIKDAPTEQSSEFGSGAGGSGGAQAAEAEQAQGAGPKKPAVDLPRVRRCIGDPPRQIEDPQSPPCVPYWAGDNGGATWRGVTRDEVRIMIPTPQFQAGTAKRGLPALELFFNKRFEFYGRKLKFVYADNQNSTGSANPQTQKADAANADEVKQVFASHMYRTTQGFYYHAELSRRGIVSATGGIMPYERSALTAQSPYLWTYLMETDAIFANLGEWACKRLAGKPANHAGDPRLQAQTRVFGIILQTYFDDDTTSTKPLEDQLRACGSPAKLVLPNPVRTPGGEENQARGAEPASATNAMLQMQQAGVTSVFCLCQGYAAGTLMRGASNQTYSPEWLLSSYGTLDFNAGVTLIANAPPEQMAHAFGLTFQPRQVKPENEPYFWAIQDIDPSFTTAQYGDSISVALGITNYRPLLLLAAGIQMAGPKLTPETFREGLRRAAFPNPPSPNVPGTVGFRPDRSAMMQDGAEIWWSTTAPGPYTDGGGGTYCYVNGGERHRRGSWPSAGDPFFSGPCDSGA